MTPDELHPFGRDLGALQAIVECWRGQELDRRHRATLGGYLAAMAMGEMWRWRFSAREAADAHMPVPGA